MAHAYVWVCMYIGCVDVIPHLLLSYNLSLEFIPMLQQQKQPETEMSAYEYNTDEICQTDLTLSQQAVLLHVWPVWHEILSK